MLSPCCTLSLLGPPPVVEYSMHCHAEAFRAWHTTLLAPHSLDAVCGRLFPLKHKLQLFIILCSCSRKGCVRISRQSLLPPKFQIISPQHRADVCHILQGSKAKKISCSENETCQALNAEACYMPATTRLLPVFPATIAKSERSAL